jgi:branched-chain amino acid transport system permease protein
VCVSAGCGVIWWMFRTPAGETILAIRDNPERASSLGISTFRYRLTAFVVAGSLAGLAGALYAFATGIVTADTLYWTRSGEPIIMCLLGGSKKFFGPVIGAIALTTLLQQVGQGSTSYLIYVGGILLVVLILLPQGLLSIPARIRQLASRWNASGPRDTKKAAAL